MPATLKRKRRCLPADRPRDEPADFVRPPSRKARFSDVSKKRAFFVTPFGATRRSTPSPTPRARQHFYGGFGGSLPIRLISSYGLEFLIMWVGGQLRAAVFYWLLAIVGGLVACAGRASNGQGSSDTSDGNNGGSGGAGGSTNTSGGSSAGGSAGTTASGGSTGGSAAGGNGATGGSATGGSAGSLAAGGSSPLPECSGGETLCDGSCVDLSTAIEHCGACGNDCDGHACEGGSCKSQCADGFTLCGNLCKNLEEDPTNCGGCGFFCNLGSPCQNGVCGCPDGSLSCQARCSDIQNDPDNCGDCGTACEAGGYCDAGDCNCPPGGAVCDDHCVNLNGAAHCGGCDETCDPDELCSAGACISSDTPCPAGSVRCERACVDTDTSFYDCGACGNSCARGQLCRAGACACPSGLTLCHGGCVDTDQSPLDCGSCGNACSAGQACEDGVCVCTNPKETLCNGRCTTLDNDRNNCGACGEACEDGSPCVDGACSCPNRTTLCGADCVDLESNAEHCGACDTGCEDGESCVLGACSGPMGDGCSDVLAHSITITELALYQTGKISIMQDGVAIAAAGRPVDVVSGKDAMVRVSFELESGFESRVLSARLLLSDSDNADALFHKRTVATNSEDGTLASTFNILVPAERITTSTRYALEIVECSDATGPLGRPRFPETLDEPLEAVSAGTLKVRIIPIVANGITPVTTPARLDPIVDFWRSMYPFESIETSLGSPMDANWDLTAAGAGWTEVLQQLAVRHYTDDAPNDLYYYGVVEPAVTLGAYCSNGCVGGIGFVTEAGPDDQHLRVAMGVSYGERVTAETAGHELGHAQGRLHAPCGGANDVDPAFPHAGAAIGWWGFEYPDTLYAGQSSTDVMGYCENRWISDYTYQAVIERSFLINGALGYLSRNPTGRFRVIVQSQFGSTWGESPPGEVRAAGTPEPAVIVDADGSERQQVSVYRAKMGDLAGAAIMVPEPLPDWYAIRIDGAPALAFEHP